MNVSEALVKLLENDGVKHVFGYPGEQILSFYKAVYESSIQHVLTRHEQGAIHAADAYGRSSGKYGVAVATAGPGAMNFIMGVSTAFKDSVPLLIITGDNNYSNVPNDEFQSFPLTDIFDTITIKSFHPSDSKTAISNFKEALSILKYYPKGPVYINLSKDVAIEDIGDLDIDFIELTPECIDLDLDWNVCNARNNLNSNLIFDEKDNYKCNAMYEDIKIAIEKISNAEKPLFIVGNGVVWGQATELLNEFVSKYNVPISTTYHSRGVVSEYDKLNLGMVGSRGTSKSNYAYLNSDCIVAVGSKLSERTTAKSPNFEEFSDKVIHINIDEKCLKGKINLPMDAKEFLKILIENDTLKEYSKNHSSKWIEALYNGDETAIEGIEDLEENYNPLRPQYAVNKIMQAYPHNYIVGDAGTHTLWSMLLAKVDKFGKFLFSGGFGPMGYGIPGAIGVAIAHPNEKILVVCGDGDIQMVSQELAVIFEYNLNISIFVLSNSELGLIRQWEETAYDFDKPYQIDLANPDFVKLAESYQIKSNKVLDKTSLELAIEESLKDDPFLAEVIVVKENVPMPK